MSGHSASQPLPSTHYRLGLALQIRLFGEPQLIRLSGERPLEILDLGVEELSIVLARVRAEEAVGAVRRRNRAHAPQRRHVGPRRIALPRVAVSPRQCRGAVQVGRTGDQCEVAKEEVVRIGPGHLVLRDAVVVDEARFEVGASLEALGVDPVDLRLGYDVAEVPGAVVVVPQDLHRRGGILLVDRRERKPDHVRGLFARRLVDDRALGAGRELAYVRVGARFEVGRCVELLQRASRRIC